MKSKGEEYRVLNKETRVKLQEYFYFVIGMIISIGEERKEGVIKERGENIQERIVIVIKRGKNYEKGKKGSVKY